MVATFSASRDRRPRRANAVRRERNSLLLPLQPPPPPLAGAGRGAPRVRAELPFGAGTVMKVQAANPELEEDRVLDPALPTPVAAMQALAPEAAVAGRSDPGHLPGGGSPAASASPGAPPAGGCWWAAGAAGGLPSWPCPDACPRAARRAASSAAGRRWLVLATVQTRVPGPSRCATRGLIDFEAGRRGESAGKQFHAALFCPPFPPTNYPGPPPGQGKGAARWGALKKAGLLAHTAVRSLRWKLGMVARIIAGEISYHRCARYCTRLPRSSVYPSFAAARSRMKALHGAPFSRAQRRTSTCPPSTA